MSADLKQGGALSALFDDDGNLAVKPQPADDAPVTDAAGNNATATGDGTAGATGDAVAGATGDAVAGEIVGARSSTPARLPDAPNTHDAPGAPDAPDASAPAGVPMPQHVPLVTKRTGWKTALSIVFSVILAPLTLAAGVLIGDTNYYLTSVLIIIYTMVPFFVSFETQRPGARELVVIAVMCALAVASRAAFFWLPHFKPMAAIIMIAGIALGSRAGFMTGSVSAFVSNFIFGQGPWTPWQMFAYGFAGFVAGFLAERGIIPRHDLTNKAKVILSACSFLFIVVIIGPILDTCALFTAVAIPTDSAGILAIYGSGLPVNIVHGAATFLTIFLVANPLLGKLDRVRVKYGMLD